MPHITFQPADQFSSEALGALFTRAYADYDVPVQLDSAGFASMVALYDIDLRASRVGLLRGEPIALALLAARGRRGWIGGMGVAPEYRGERAGRAVMKAVIDSARRSGLQSIDLEVLTQNLPAIRIYDALGFHRRRLLDIWRRDSDATFPMPPHHDVRALEAPACLAAFDEMHATTSPWQRDLPVLQRMADGLHALGIVENDRVGAYVLYRMNGARVGIVDAAAAPGSRAAAIESVLRTLIRERAGSPIRFSNVPQDDPASTAMYRIGAEVEMQQHEMTVEL